MEGNDLPSLASGVSSLDDEQANALLRLLKTRKIKGQIGNVNYEIGTSKAKLDGNFNGTLADLAVKYNGDWNAGVRTPLFGGKLTINANETNGQRFYGAQFQRSF